MKCTALAYTAFASELVVELSLSSEAPDGTDEPMKFVGRIVRPGAGESLETPAQMVHAVARVLVELAMDLAEESG